MSGDLPPYRADLARGPAPDHLEWLTASDGLRLRAGVWRGGSKGTILLFTGRTEFLEKYGELIGDFTAAGFCVASLDWRGQGQSARETLDPQIGHVADFRDYQRDVAALMDWVARSDLPRPLFLFAHSMGGLIGLRALAEGLEVKAAVFSAPMWNIALAPHLRLATRVLLPALRALGRGADYAPMTGPHERMVFDDNPLTNDPDRLALMFDQAAAEPMFRTGGPSCDWLFTALADARRMARMDVPDLPCLTLLGSAEKIVCPKAIRARMARWPQGELLEIAGARHEILMECDALRAPSLAAVLAHFTRA